MKRSMRLFVSVMLFVSLFFAGCTPETPVRPPQEAGTVFQRPIVETRHAARNALAELGFQIVQDTGIYVEGMRPLVGEITERRTGGEKVGIWLDEQSDQSTLVLINTERTGTNISRQEEWDMKVLKKMMEALR